MGGIGGKGQNISEDLTLWPEMLWVQLEAEECIHHCIVIPLYSYTTTSTLLHHCMNIFSL